jgi:type IV secretory pathway TraG/TraD family ATPase VirD4
MIGSKKRARRNNAIGPDVALGVRRKPLWRMAVLPGWLLFTVVGSFQSATSAYVHMMDNAAGLLKTAWYWPFVNQPFAIVSWGRELFALRGSVSDAVYQASETVYLHAVMVGALAFTLGLAVFVFLRMRLRIESPNENMHGSARWANRDDLVAVGLLGAMQGGTPKAHSGVFVGQWRNPKTGKDEFLRHDGPEHVIAVAPTRSGKGVGLVVPTLLSWRESVVVNDIKSELFAMTSGWRQSIDQRIIAFQPGGGADSCPFDTWNPLFEIRPGAHGVDDAQNISTLIVDPDGKGIDDHWRATAATLLTGMQLYVIWLHRTGALAPGAAVQRRNLQARLDMQMQEALKKKDRAIKNEDKQAAQNEIEALELAQRAEWDELEQKLRDGRIEAGEAHIDPFNGKTPAERAKSCAEYTKFAMKEPPAYPVATISQIDTLLAEAGGPKHPFWARMVAAGKELSAFVGADLSQLLKDQGAAPSKAIRDRHEDCNEGGKYHGWGAVIRQAALDMMNRPPEEAGSVLSTAKRMLELYRSPIVAKATSSSSFSTHDLMDGDKVTSLYIITPPSDKGRLRPLVRLLLNSIIRNNARTMEYEGGRAKQAHKHRMLMMIDEFLSLGKLPLLQESLAYAAGYGIKYYLICQDMNQLQSPEEGYGTKETITAGCQVQAAFPPNTPETAKYLSDKCGTTTIIKKQVTMSGGAGHAMLSQAQEVMQEVSRPLLTPDEVTNMPAAKKGAVGSPPKDGIIEPGKMLVFAPGCPAIFGVQPLYFKEAAFAARAAIPPVKREAAPQ